jgi:RNA polymerase sigma-70 factor (ECF subfamily)
MPADPKHPIWKDKDPDEVLLQASLQDAEAFAVLVGRYERKVYGLLWRLCPRASEIDDLYQQVWIRAWGARLSFEGRSKFGTWLYAITLNQVREWRRRQKPQVDLESLPEREAPGLNALDRLLGRDSHAQVRVAMSRMPGGDQEILTLRYLQELEYDEIAKLLRCSLAQARLRVFRGLQRLRKAMKDHDR